MPVTSWPVGRSAGGGAFGSRLGPRPGSLGGLVDGGGSAGVEGGGVVPAGGIVPEVSGGMVLPPLEPPPLLEPPPPPELPPPELLLGGLAFLRGWNSKVPTTLDPRLPFTVTVTVKSSRVEYVWVTDAPALL